MVANTSICYQGERDNEGYAIVVRRNHLNDPVAVDLDPRLDLRIHSPTGFEWGYNGSGPSQLALAILADFTGDDELAQKHYIEYRRREIAQLHPDMSWVITGARVEEKLQTIIRDSSSARKIQPVGIKSKGEFGKF